MGNTSKTDAISVNTAEKAKQALELRLRGLSYDQIGTAIGMSKSRAHQLVKEAIDDIPKEAASEVLQMELATLSKLQEVYMAVALKGAEVQTDFHGTPCLVLADTTKNAAMILMRVLERRAKYLGLDAPEKAELTGKDGSPLNGPVIYIPAESSDE